MLCESRTKHPAACAKQTYQGGGGGVTLLACPQGSACVPANCAEPAEWRVADVLLQSLVDFEKKKRRSTVCKWVPACALITETPYLHVELRTRSNHITCSAIRKGNGQDTDSSYARSTTAGHNGTAYKRRSFLVKPTCLKIFVLQGDKTKGFAYHHVHCWWRQTNGNEPDNGQNLDHLAGCEPWPGFHRMHNNNVSANTKKKALCQEGFQQIYKFNSAAVKEGQIIGCAAVVYTVKASKRHESTSANRKTLRWASEHIQSPEHAQQHKLVATSLCSLINVKKPQKKKQRNKQEVPEAGTWWSRKDT